MQHDVTVDQCPPATAASPDTTTEPGAPLLFFDMPQSETVPVVPLAQASTDPAELQYTAGRYNGLLEPCCSFCQHTGTRSFSAAGYAVAGDTLRTDNGTKAADARAAARTSFSDGRPSLEEEEEEEETE